MDRRTAAAAGEFSIRSTAIIAARREHDFFLPELALVRGARIHHVEYFGLIRDVLVMRYGAISIGIDLVHHGLGAKPAGVAAGGEGHHVAAVGTDELFRVDLAGLALIEHRKRL